MMFLVTHPLVPTPSMRTSGAAAGVLAGVASAVSGFLPLPAATVVFVVLAALLAFGWPRLLNLPSPRGTVAVLGTTAVVLAVVMLTTHSGQRTRWAGACLCLGLIGSFLHQLLRSDGRPRLVMSVAGTALGLAFLGSGSYLIAAHDSSTSRHLLVAMGAAVAVGALLDGALGSTSRRFELGAVHVVLGACAGAIAVAAGAPWLAAVSTGALSGLIAWSALRTTVTNATSAHTRAQLAAGSACSLICCFVPFVVAQIS